MGGALELELGASAGTGGGGLEGRQFFCLNFRKFIIILPIILNQLAAVLGREPLVRAVRWEPLVLGRDPSTILPLRVAGRWRRLPSGITSGGRRPQ